MMEENVNYFQAIGVIVGRILINDNKVSVVINGKEYDLRPAPNHSYVFKRIKQENNNSLFRLVVYPKLTHFPERDKVAKLQFQLVAFEKSIPNNQRYLTQLKNNEFILRGLWQFIPVCRYPVISVFRNFTEDRLEVIKNSELNKKARFMKANHIPVFWKDSVVPPFKYNPKSEEQSKPYFVQIKTKLNLERETFNFVSLLDMPNDQPPKYLKLSKQDKKTIQENKPAKTKPRYKVNPLGS